MSNPARVMYEVENTMPRTKGARKALVYRFVVLAATEDEAIARAIDQHTLAVLGACSAETLAEARKDSLSDPLNGTWAATEVDGFVFQRQTVLR